MRLGWSFGEKEIFTIEEIKKKFSLENIGKSPSKHDKKKLDFLNNYYLKITDNKTLFNFGYSYHNILRYFLLLTLFLQPTYQVYIGLILSQNH